jgi:hypothetical protein
MLKRSSARSPREEHTMARILLLAGLGLTLICAPAAAQNEGKWGALAFGGPDQAAGWAVDHPSPAEAREAALQACGGRCIRTFVFLRSCAAVAESPAGAVGSSINRWSGRAIARALSQCGEGCTISVAACTMH